MAVTFVLGRAGSGKTHYCLDAILSELARPDQIHRLVFLVPEQASFQMERALATRAPHGGYWRAEVLSFSRLAWRVFDETGQPPTFLSPQARALALRSLAAHAGTALRALRRAARTQGFFAQLDQLIEELLREDVTPAALLAAAEQLDDAATARKVREISQLYTDYIAWLGPERIDAAARLAVLRDRLTRLDWLPEAAVWVDGFAGFTGQELRTLVALAGRAREVTITLLVDPAAPAIRDPRQTPDPLALFQRTEATYQRLRALFTDAGIEVRPPVELRPQGLPRFAEAPTLGTLEAGLATPLGAADSPPASTPAPPDLTLRECITHRDELRAAARWIRTLIADSGGTLHFRDFALIARDLEPFAQLIAEVFAEYDLPYFLDRRRPMRSHALSRLLPALLAAMQTDFDVQPMVRLLRTRLSPLSRDDAEQLENILVNEAVRGIAAWRCPAWELRQAGEAIAAFAPQRARIVAALEPLLPLIADEAGVTGAVWAETLYRVLTHLNVQQRIEQWIADARRERRWESVETHRLAWGAVCEVLQDLHDVLGQTRVPASEVTGILSTSLREVTLGFAPPTVDQVLVSSIERSRHPEIKHAWVFAFNEGTFPARPPDDLLLSTAEREALNRAGLSAPTSHREDALNERLLAYIAFTRPSRSLTISFARVADDGAELLPSPLLEDIRRTLPGLRATREAPYAPPVSVGELARQYLAVRRDDRRRHERRRYERLVERVRTNPAQSGSLDWLLRGIGYKNEPSSVGNHRRPATGPADVVWDTSPSEVEKYLQCPFKHFAAFGLRLDAARGPRPLRWDLGEVAHAILADVTRRGMEEPGGVRAITDARWQALLDEAMQTFWSQRPAEYAQRRPDLVFMGRVLHGFLGDVIAGQAARWRRGEFEPLYCEQAFNPSGQRDALRGIELTLGEGQRIYLHGKIDRVDVCHQGDQTLLLVYDYKSGGVQNIRANYLTGNRLQLFLYLLACRQSSAGNPVGVFLAPLYPDPKVLKNDFAAEADPLEQTMFLYRPRGLLTETAARLLDHELGSTTSPVAQLQLKKDGGFHARSDARPKEEIDQRLELAAQTVQFAAEGLCAGRIEVAPLVENHQLACRNCEFQAVCRYDPAYNAGRPAEAVLPRLEKREPEGEDTP